MYTKVILEMGCNHQGDMAIAKRMIDEAKKLNVYGVKFQKRCVDLIPEEKKIIRRSMSNSFGENYYEHRKVLEFSPEQIEELKKHAEVQGLFFAVSVFDAVSAKEMISIGVKGIKLPSQLYSDNKLNQYLLTMKKLKKLFLMHSTGMHTVNEIINHDSFDQFDVTFYCRSIYPFSEMEKADLGSAMEMFSMLDNSQCGYSSHDKDGKLIPWFILIGAQWIERHYTLDKEMKGSDHKTVSSDYAEMKRILFDIEETEERRRAKNYDKIVDTQELSNQKFYRGF